MSTESATAAAAAAAPSPSTPVASADRAPSPPPIASSNTTLPSDQAVPRQPQAARPGADSPAAGGASAGGGGPSPQAATHHDSPATTPACSASYESAREQLQDDHSVELYAVAAAQAAEAILQRQAREAELKAQRAAAKAREDNLRKAVASWEKLLKSGKVDVGSRSVRALLRQGVPSQLRGRVWPLLIGNKLQVTPELFSIFKQHAKTARALVFRERELLAREMRTTTQAPASAEPVAAPAGAGEAAPAPALLGKEDTVGLIELDVPRTFPELAFFAVGGPLHEPLRDVLEAYTCFRPDVGYVQGMSFLAAMLLLNMGPEAAFSAFANLLANNVYFDFYRLDMDRMQVHLAAYEQLLQQNLPRLFAHFEAEGVQSSQYIVTWLLTLFTRALPLDVACRVWDEYLARCHSDDIFVWRVVIAVLSVLQDRLLQEDVGGILAMLNSIPDDVTADALLAAADRVKLTQRSFNAFVERVRARFSATPAAAETPGPPPPQRTAADADGGWIQAPAFVAAHASVSPQGTPAAGEATEQGAAEGADETGGGLFAWMRRKVGAGS